jgi:hypothetical protein
MGWGWARGCSVGDAASAFGLGLGGPGERGSGGFWSSFTLWFLPQGTAKPETVKPLKLLGPGPGCMKAGVYTVAAPQFKM